MGQRGFWDKEHRIQKLQDKLPVFFSFLLRSKSYLNCLINIYAPRATKREGQIIDAILVPVPWPLGICEAITTQHTEGERDHQGGGYLRKVVGTAKTVAAEGY
jgi:hypothetical protein